MTQVGQGSKVVKWVKGIKWAKESRVQGTQVGQGFQGVKGLKGAKKSRDSRVQGTQGATQSGTGV